MTLDDFVSTYGLLPADAMVVKKEPFRLLDHYIIYLGKYSGRHTLIANYVKGTRILSDQEIAAFSQEFSPDRIVRFRGNDIQRNAAVRRALSRKDQISYHLILNNCEHYSSYVQTGTPYSRQTKTFGTGLVFTGLITAASTKKSEVQTVGLFAAALGLITLLLDDDN